MKGIFALAGLALLAAAIFWGTVAYVAAHFIEKLW